MARSTWTERKIQEMEAEGYGRGIGSQYKPWVHVQDFSSRGTSRRALGLKTGRMHQLLSDVEYELFLMLDWSREFTDVREQYPLDRDVTQTIAGELGIRHPCYPGTRIPTVMTVDFLCERLNQGQHELVAFDAKRSEDTENETALQKLEIQRAALECIGIRHHLVFHSELPKQKIRNIEWIRDAELRSGEHEPRPGYWSEMAQRLLLMFPRAKPELRLHELCRQFDEQSAAPRGTGLRAVRLLMLNRSLVPNLGLPSLQQAPLSSFGLAEHCAPPLRVAGGI